jgi:hypothetical protein
MVALRGAARHLQHLAHGRTLGDHAPKVVTAFGILNGIAHAHAQCQHLRRPLDGIHHVGDMKWLDQEVVRAQLHGFHRAIDQVVRAHHYHDHGGRNLPRLRQHLDAVDAGQHYVQKREVRLFLGDDLQRVFPIDGRKHVVALSLQRASDGAQGERLVIDNQDGVLHG